MKILRRAVTVLNLHHLHQMSRRAVDNDVEAGTVCGRRGDPGGSSPSPRRTAGTAVATRGGQVRSVHVAGRCAARTADFAG